MTGVARTSLGDGSIPLLDRPSTTRLRVAAAPSVVLVGASTGGPQALTLFASGLAPAIPTLPVCVTLHMPAELMPVIATHVARTSGIETRIVEKEQLLRPGLIYFAPGDRYLVFRRRDGAAVTLALTPAKSGAYCKPAVDVMLASAAACFGRRALAVVLSGMGKDGLAGAKAVVAAGGSVVVQDKSTSAVWGMPGAIAKADLAAAMLSPTALAAHVVDRLPTAGRAR